MFSKKFKASGLANIRANDSGVVNNKSGIEKSCFFFFTRTRRFDYYYYNFQTVSLQKNIPQRCHQTNRITPARSKEQHQMHRFGGGD